LKEAVVDASVAVKWVVEEEYITNATLLLDYDTLYAPAHWRAEAVNVLWAKVFRGDLTAADAEERMAVLNRAPIVETGIAELVPRAFAISVAHAVTIYDSLYVALAAQRDILLVTADERLVRQLSERSLRSRVVLAGNLPAS